MNVQASFPRWRERSVYAPDNGLPVLCDVDVVVVGAWVVIGLWECVGFV